MFFSVHLFIDPCPQLSITMFFVLFLYRFIHASVRLPLLPAIHPSFCWQHQKRSNSARLSHFLQLKISKPKQFCESSFKNGKLTVQLTASYQCVLRFFHAMSLKYCACHEKVSPGHTKCCTCHEKASWHSWWFDTPKCNPSQEISSLSSEHLCWRCLLYCACHEKCICADPLQISQACHRFWKCYNTLTF